MDISLSVTQPIRVIDVSSNDDVNLQVSVSVPTPMVVSSFSRVGDTGPGLPIGGSVGDVPAKSGLVDYVIEWAKRDRVGGVIAVSQTLLNSAVEAVLYTGSIPAASLKALQYIKTHLSGQMSTEDSLAYVTLRLYLGDVLVAFAASTAKEITDASWNLKFNMTVRTIGETGTVSTHTAFRLDDTTSFVNNTSLTLDTTIEENLIVTAQWSTAGLGNSIQVDQGIMEFKN